MKDSPNLSVMVFTINEENEKLFEALIPGACGYIAKTTSPGELLTAIKNAAETASPINSDTAKRMVVLLRELDAEKKEKQEILTERENEVLSEIALGKKYKQIAETLFLSVHTVRYHIRNIYDKFHVHSQSEAIAIALRKGLI